MICWSLTSKSNIESELARSVGYWTTPVDADFIIDLDSSQHHVTDNLSSMAYDTNHTPQQIFPDYDDRYQNASAHSTVRRFSDPQCGTLSSKSRWWQPMMLSSLIQQFAPKCPRWQPILRVLIARSTLTRCPTWTLMISTPISSMWLNPRV